MTYDLPPTDACAGTSADLIDALVSCLCTACPGCEEACEQQAEQGQCKTELDACTANS